MASAGIAAGIGAASSILGGITGGKGAKKAARIQAQAYEKGLAQQQAQWNQTQQNFAPFLQGGTQGLEAYLGLLGLRGNGLQGEMINDIKNGREFASLYDTGADTILQNAAATGGLRGGNTQNSLAQFGSGLLSSLIQQRLGNYGGLIQMGAGTAGNLGQLGAQNSAQAGQMLTQQGGYNAVAAGSPYASWANIFSQIGGNAQGLSGLFAGKKPDAGTGTAGSGPDASGSVPHDYRGTGW